MAEGQRPVTLLEPILSGLLDTARAADGDQTVVRTPLARHVGAL